MRIDAHIHFWRVACGFDNRPIADQPAYRRDFLPEHVMHELDACAIDRVLLVQTCPQTEETAWIVDLAERNDRIAGVTAWVDLDDVRCDFRPLLSRNKVVGIRAQLRRIDDSQFVTRSRVVANLASALDAHLGVTILAEHRHYRPLMDALERLPSGPITVNHLGLRFPDVDAQEWRVLMRTLAERPQSFVQLSGLPFLYGERWRDDDVGRVLDEALDILGPRRLLFASDWPMLVRFATYTEWVRTVERFVQRRKLAQRDVDAIFAGNVIAANPRLDAALDDATKRLRDASYPHSSSRRPSEKRS